MSSKRGTHLVLFDGNTYTPNERAYPGQYSRNWKCSLYYKCKCRARIITREFLKQGNRKEVIKVAVADHTHPQVYPQYSQQILKVMNKNLLNTKYFH